jgi:hypothetical protein
MSPVPSSIKIGYIVPSSQTSPVISAVPVPFPWTEVICWFGWEMFERRVFFPSYCQFPYRSMKHQTDHKGHRARYQPSPVRHSILLAAGR